MSRAVARRGLPAGAASRAFRLTDLAAAAARAKADTTTVFVELEAGEEKVLRACGGGSVGAAAWAGRCGLACASPPRALLEPAGAAGAAGGGWARVRLLEPHAPHDDLLVWPHPALFRNETLPVLTPTNITGSGEYACVSCGARFLQPNLLKVHMYLGCSAPEPAALWRRLAESPRPTLSGSPRLSSLSGSPRLSSLTGSPLAPSSPGPCAGAALEALATAWGRAAAGHLCLYCGKLYSRRYGLKIHIRTHTGYKPLRCRHCARAFGDPSNLNKHVRLHDQARHQAPAHRDALKTTTRQRVPMYLKDEVS